MAADAAKVLCSDSPTPQERRFEFGRTVLVVQKVCNFNAVQTLISGDVCSRQVKTVKSIGG